MKVIYGTIPAVDRQSRGIEESKTRVGEKIMRDSRELGVIFLLKHYECDDV